MPAPGSVKSPDLFVGRILGIPIYLGPSWFFVAVLLTVLYAPDVERAVSGIGGRSYLVSFSFALLLYGSVLIHELGHSVVARWLGLPVRRITLHAFVGLSEIEKEPPTPAKEAMVAAAGPAMSVVLAVGAAALVPHLERGTVLRVLAVGLMISNAIVAVLNMLPGLPLDGGRVFRAAVWRVSHNPLRATTTAAWAGRMVGITVGLAGTAWGNRVGGASALYNTVVSVMVGWFIYAGASSALRSAKVQTVLPQLQARTLTRRAIPVAADVPLAEALRRLALASARALVVVDGQGRPTAIVSEAAVAAVPENRRPWVDVGTLARSVSPDTTVDADLAGAELLSALQAAPAEDHLVTEANGRVYGVLSTSDVAAAISGAAPR
ncbi:MAG: site-2 protease family protein [Frankiaceae bacterium]